MNALTLVASLAFCQTAEVRYLDGSLVMMTFEKSEIELQTKYGKLTIPVSEVRRIDFGVVISSSELKSFILAASDLASQNYKKREDATDKLLSFGPNAYAFVRDWQPPDLESQTRRAKIIRDFESRLSSEVTGRTRQTVVHTTEFTVSGNLVGDDLMATSTNFGRQAVKFNTVFAIVVEQPLSEVTVEAKNVNKWLDTGIQADSRMSLKVTADGQIDLWPQEPGKYMVGPTGYSSVGQGSSFMAGQLIGRIGEKGTPFTVGQSLSWSNYESGRLFLQIVPAPWPGADPTGQYRVRVKQVGR